MTDSSWLEINGGCVPYGEFYGIEPDEWDWDDEPEEQEFDCGWVDDEIGCTMAGSEDCDFECPYSDSYHNRRNTIATDDSTQPNQPTSRDS